MRTVACGVAVLLLASGCVLYTPAGSDPEAPRLLIPPYEVADPALQLVGTAGPGRDLEVYVNGHPAGTTSADEDGDFVFERVMLHPGLNIVRVVLLPTESELREGAGTPMAEHRYEPPPYAEVRVAFVRQPGR